MEALREFASCATDVALGGEEEKKLDRARKTVLEMYGEEGLKDAAAVIGSFNCIPRIVDGA